MSASESVQSSERSGRSSKAHLKFKEHDGVTYDGTTVLVRGKPSRSSLSPADAVTGMQLREPSGSTSTAVGAAGSAVGAVPMSLSVLQSSGSGCGPLTVPVPVTAASVASLPGPLHRVRLQPIAATSPVRAPAPRSGAKVAPLHVSAPDANYAIVQREGPAAGTGVSVAPPSHATRSPGRSDSADPSQSPSPNGSDLGGRARRTQSSPSGGGTGTPTISSPHTVMGSTAKSPLGRVAIAPALQHDFTNSEAPTPPATHLSRQLLSLAPSAAPLPIPVSRPSRVMSDELGDAQLPVPVAASTAAHADHAVSGNGTGIISRFAQLRTYKLRARSRSFRDTSVHSVAPTPTSEAKGVPHARARTNGRLTSGVACGFTSAATGSTVTNPTSSQSPVGRGFLANNSSDWSKRAQLIMHSTGLDTVRGPRQSFVAAESAARTDRAFEGERRLRADRSVSKDSKREDGASPFKITLIGLQEMDADASHALPTRRSQSSKLVFGQPRLPKRIPRCCLVELYLSVKESRAAKQKRVAELRTLANNPSFLDGPAGQVAILAGINKLELRKLAEIFYVDLEHNVDTNQVTGRSFLDWAEVQATKFTLNLFQLISRNLTTSGSLKRLDDFVVAVMTLCLFSQSDLLRFLFDSIDADDSGSVSQEEYIALLQMMSSGEGAAFPGSYKKMLEGIDTNKDGTIQFTEFYALAQKFPLALFPLFALQIQVQKATLGQEAWLRMRRRVDALIEDNMAAAQSAKARQRSGSASKK